MNTAEVDETDLLVPDAEVLRRATGALGGYQYQLYQTAIAWMDLPQSARLLVEVAEDFAILCRGALSNTQVKDTAGSGAVTLRTKGIVQLLNSHWRFQESNPNRIVRSVYLTSSPIGRENGWRGPRDLSGIEYWQVCQREGADAAPLRELLLTLDLDAPLRAFVEQAPCEEFVERVVRRLTWICGAPPVETVREELVEKLIYHGENAGFGPIEAQRAADAIIVALLKKASESSVEPLSRAALLSLVQSATEVSLPASSLRAISRGMVADTDASLSYSNSFLSVRQIPLPSAVVPRSAVVENIRALLAEHGAVWLQGSSGLGKTMLAQFVGLSSKREWYLVELRDAGVAEVRARLRSVLHLTSEPDFGGVVLDDFPVEHAASTRALLAVVRAACERVGGALLVTCAQQWSSSFVRDRRDICTQTAPYLDRSEVAELIAMAGGDAEAWSGVIHAFCGGGHPQLVAARIAGLKHRGWPRSEMLAGIDPHQPDRDVEDEKAAIRRRLVAELSDEGRELLFRLSAVSGRLDRELAIAIARVPPAVQRPGEVLDALVGPWLEVRSENRYSVSPLLSGAAKAAFDPEFLLRLHAPIVDHLLQRRPFPAEHLNTLLFHALAARHRAGLYWLAGAVFLAEREKEAAIAAHLSVLPLLRTDAPLFPEERHVSVLLRLAQLKVAISENSSLAGSILEAALRECSDPELGPTGPALLLVAAMTGVLSLSVKLSPARWLRAIEQAEAAYANAMQLLGDHVQFPSLGGERDWTPAEAAFVLRSTHLQTLDELEELFAQLGLMSTERREAWLGALEGPYTRPRDIIRNAWAAHVRDGDVDGHDCARRLAVLRDVARGWGRVDLAIECACAQSIMLDEYGHDRDAALAVLQEASEFAPGDVRLLRQRARVFYHYDEHETAFEALNAVAEDLPADEPFDRAYAFREGANSAAQIEDWGAARILYARAREEALRAGTLNAMAIGLSADEALAAARSGAYHDALDLLLRAARELSPFEPDPEASLRHRYFVVPAAVNIVISWYLGEPSEEIFIGACSKPHPSDADFDRPTPPPQTVWYWLNALSVVLGKAELVQREYDDATAGGHVAELYTAMITRIARAALRDGPSEFAPKLVEFAKVTSLLQTFRAMRGDQPWTVLERVPTSYFSGDLSDPSFLLALNDGVLAYSGLRKLKREPEPMLALLQAIESVLRERISLTVIDALGETAPRMDDHILAAAVAFNRLSTDDGFAPRDLLWISFVLLMWISSSFFGVALQKELWRVLSSHWLAVTKMRTFMLSQPMRSVPAISRAIEEGPAGQAGLARLVLAADLGVTNGLSADSRSLVERLIAKSTA